MLSWFIDAENNKLVFECGCKFDIVTMRGDKMPRISIDYENLPDCRGVWDMIGQGKVKGVFQLESQFGKQWAQDVKPESLEHMSALGAILRPGCVSGDTLVSVNMRNSFARTRVLRCSKIKIKDLYEKFHNNHFNFNTKIVSIDETTNIAFNNIINNVIYSGKKDVYKLKLKYRKRTSDAHIRRYQLKATLDHKFLTHDRGWIELKDLKDGERIAVINGKKQHSKPVKNFPGQRYFAEICYSKQKITQQECLIAREKLKVRNTKHIQWLEYNGCDLVCTEDTYDLQVCGPNHNFIANNIVVHNCLQSVDDENISTTKHYSLRKNGLEPIPKVNPIVDEILKDTYGLNIYQEDSINMGMKIAGFTAGEADTRIRKGLGKKDTAIIAKTEKQFLDGAAKSGIVSDELAKQLFSSIKAGQRYAFNKTVSEDTMITTLEGDKLLKHVNIGDYVKAPDKDKDKDIFVKVINKYDHGIQDLYEIKTESGKTIQSTIEHKFLCEDWKMRPLYEIIEHNLKIICE